MRCASWSAMLMVAALAGCDQMNTERSSAPLPETGPPAADNTAINQRDASGATKTPIDQDENPADIKRTAEIRKKILDQPEMSINAQNVKVITSHGRVTLRGPVDSDGERDIVVRIATEVAGADSVVNELEVTPAGRKSENSINPKRK